MSKDIIVFTLHKSASMFIHKQCEFLCKQCGITHHSPNNVNNALDVQELLVNKDMWATRSGCFAPIRFFIDVPQLENYEIILHLRDPRDVLVSMFYSYCYIHVGEIAENTGHRQEAAAKGIDAFVLGKASDKSSDYPGDYGSGGHMEDLIGNLPTRYNNYIEHLLGRPNVTFVKYEEMVTDYRSWLEKFIMPFQTDDKEGIIDILVTQSPKFFPKRSKDVMKHIRRITPGDHKNKLKPATIQQLNEVFSNTLDALGYKR